MRNKYVKIVLVNITLFCFMHRIFDQAGGLLGRLNRCVQCQQIGLKRYFITPAI